MARYRNNLPQLGGDLFLTDSGLETDLVFNKGFDLPCFSTIPLLGDETARQAIIRYYLAHIDIARRFSRGLILETPTWRASPDWAKPLGLDVDALAGAVRDGVALVADVAQSADMNEPLVISGNIGPRGDGYDPGAVMTAAEAEAYHGWQVGLFKETSVDLVTAMTITNAPEAIGFVNAAARAELPAVVSFTVETDGRLPTGQALGEAIMETDFEARKAPAYYMINCAHPDHFSGALARGVSWTKRIQGLRGNASRMSHAELDEAESLDDGDPREFGALNREIVAKLGHINIIGGCCGTDHRHVDEICRHDHREAA